MTDVHMVYLPSLPSSDVLYFHLKRQLRSVGLAVDDVLEEGQAPSTYSEPEVVETLPPPEPEVVETLPPPEPEVVETLPLDNFSVLST